MGTKDIVERRPVCHAQGWQFIHPAGRGVRTKDEQFTLRVTGKRYRRRMRETKGERVAWVLKPPLEHSVEEL